MWVKCSHLLHYYEIKLIKNIFDSKQGRQNLQKCLLNVTTSNPTYI